MFGSIFPLPFVFNSSFFLVFMKEKPKFELNIEIVQTKKTIQFLKKYSQRDQSIVIVSTIHLQYEHRIFRTSIQKISRIYISTAVLYRWIDCFISVYWVAVLKSLPNFPNKINCRNFHENSKKGG